MLRPTMFRSAIAIFWPELADYWASNVGICGSAVTPLLQSPSLWHSMTLSPLPFDKSWLRPRSCRYFVGVHKGVVLNHISKQNCFQFSKCLFFLKKLHLKSSNSWNSIYYKLNLYRHGTGVVNENKNMFIKSEKTDNQSTSYKTIYYNSL